LPYEPLSTAIGDPLGISSKSHRQLDSAKTLSALWFARPQASVDEAPFGESAEVEKSEKKLEQEAAHKTEEVGIIITQNQDLECNQKGGCMVKQDEGEDKEKKTQACNC